jgi:arabinose-5-phosphate isomerase
VTVRTVADDAALYQALEAGHDVLARARAAVDAAASRFDGARDVLALLLGAPGRIVVTGLGKSGLVGAKMAATLASTGTPSLFVHAADALHGDAGMVVDGDVLVAISKSGTTSEVVQFAQMVKKRGVQVVAVTGCGGGSPLCRVADARLDVSVEVEGDPWDLVPTTSTAVTSVIGDAVAVALMVARGFGPADFLLHHPGGALGQRASSGPRTT